MKNPPNAGLFRLIWPPEGSDAPKPKTGYPAYIAEVEHIPFFWDAARTKNAQSSKCSGEGYICTLQQVPTSTTRPKTFHFWNRVPFHFLGQKSQKEDLKVPFSISKNSFNFNDLLARASEHKSEFFFVFKFSKKLKFLIFLKKRIWFPLELQL